MRGDVGDRVPEGLVIGDDVAVRVDHANGRDAGERRDALDQVVVACGGCHTGDSGAVAVRVGRVGAAGGAGEGVVAGVDPAGELVRDGDAAVEHGEGRAGAEGALRDRGEAIDLAQLRGRIVLGGRGGGDGRRRGGGGRRRRRGDRRRVGRARRGGGAATATAAGCHQGGDCEHEGDVLGLLQPVHN